MRERRLELWVLFSIFFTKFNNAVNSDVYVWNNVLIWNEMVFK